MRKFLRKLFLIFIYLFNRVIYFIKTLIFIGEQYLNVAVKELKGYLFRLDSDRNERYIFFFHIIFLMFSFLIFYLFIICILHKGRYYYINNENKFVTNDRPSVVDRNGIILAKNITLYDLYFYSSKVLNFESELRKIFKILPKTSSKFEKIFISSVEKLDSKNSPVLIQMNLTDTERDLIIDSGVIGIEFQKKKSRYYLQENIASHILGIVSDDGVGVSGMEKYLETLNLKDDEKLELSIDIRAQSVLYDKLIEIMRKSFAKGAFGIIVDVKTGEILSAVSLPDYNPNQKITITSDNAFNRFSLGVYEFGSVFKIFNASLALENGITLDKKYNVKDDIQIGNRIISDMKKSRDEMTVEEIVLYSSNIGSARILLDIEDGKQMEFYKNLGFTTKLEYELPEKGKPIYPSEKEWTGMRSVTMSYGHGIAITQTQLARAFIGILNNGKMGELTLIKRKDQNKEDCTNCLSVISEKTSSSIRELMKNVVEKGAGARARSEYYSIGAKSGTAIKILQSGKYTKTKNLLSFIGTVPSEDPKYAFIISLDEPKFDIVNRFNLVGGHILGPVVKDLIESTAIILKTPNKRNIVLKDK